MMNKVTHNIHGVMGLQKCMDIVKSELGPCSNTCQMSSDDGKQGTGKRGEEFTYIKVEEDPWPATSAGIETEPALSFVCVCVCFCVPCYSHGTDIQNFLSIVVFLSA